MLTVMLLKASVLIAMLLFEMLTLNPNCVRLQARVSVVVLEYTADGGMCAGNRGGTYPPEGVWPDATATHLSPDVAILGTACVDLPAAPPTSGMYVAVILRHACYALRFKVALCCDEWLGSKSVIEREAKPVQHHVHAHDHDHAIGS